jgi:hypothetical protein
MSPFFSCKMTQTKKPTNTHALEFWSDASTPPVLNEAEQWEDGF